MRLFASLASVSALALMAAETGSTGAPPETPPAPTPEELKVAEEARELALANLAKVKEETAAAQAEAEALTKAAQEAKSKASEEKAAADAEIKAAEKAKAKAKTEKASAEAAIAAAKVAQQRALEAAAALPQSVLEPSAEVEVVEPYSGPRQAIVWAEPGNQMLAIGVLVSVPADEAEALRARGRARFASPEEVEAGGDDIPQLQGL